MGGQNERGASLTAADTVRREEQGEIGAAAAPSSDVTEEEEDNVLAPRRMRMKAGKGEKLDFEKNLFRSVILDYGDIEPNHLVAQSSES